MVAIPSPTTVSVGGRIGGTLYNTDVRDGINWFLSSRPMCMVTQTVVQSGWTSGVTFSITFTNEVIDRDGQHSNVTNTERIVIGNTLGWYRVSGVVAFAGNAVATFYRANIGLNNVGVSGSYSTLATSGSTTSSNQLVTPTVFVQATSSTDYVSLHGNMVAASGTLGTTISGAVTSSLTAEWVGA